MKALVIAPQPFFTPRGTPFSVYYRTLVTAELGVKIDLLTYGEGADVDIPGVRIIRIPRFPGLGPIPIGPSGLKLFLDVFIVLWTLRLLLRDRYDVVHAHEEAIFFCRFLKPLFGFRLIYDMHSSLPQQLENFRFTTSRFLIGLFRLLEDSSLRAADAVITICPDLADYATGRLRKPEKHILIENSIFEPVRLPGAKAASADSETSVVFPEGRKTVVYAGTLEAYQGIDLLVKGFADVLAMRSDAFLVVVGGTPEQAAHFRRMADELGISEHARFTGRVPQAQARQFVQQADVQVSPRSAGTNTPLKIYEQLASGIPLVATNIWSHTQALTKDVSFLVPPTPEGLAEGILAALDPKGEGAKRAENARRLYGEKYARPAYVEKMKRLFRRIAPCAASPA